MRPLTRRLAGLLALTLVAALLPGCAANRGAQAESAPDFAADYRRHAVAADHPLASAAGLEVLRAGGNAVDAAVATSFALSVVRPFSCGIGGGGFMVIHFERPPDGSTTRDIAINYREMAPAAITPDFYAARLDRDRADLASRTGGTAAGVPGTVAGLLHAHERFGRLSREQVLAPAIRLAEEGFEADEAYVRAVTSISEDFAAHADWPQRFAFVWNRYLMQGQVAVGDRIHIPEQADALRLIARDGAAAFYTGPIADAIVRAVQSDGGLITRDDLRNYRPNDAQPLTFDAFGRTFLTMPPPSSGGVTLAQTLGLLEREWNPEPINNRVIRLDHFPLYDERLRPESSTDTVASAMTKGPGWSLQWRDAQLIECFQLAFADRAAWLGDPDFVGIPLDRLLSSDYLDQRATLIDQQQGPQPPEHYLDPDAAAELLTDHGTSHLSVVDRWGNAVACTETINLEFGSLLAVPEYGFILNDQMDDFTSRVGEPNAFGLRQSARNLPQPGKRPLSSMTPTIVLDASGQVEVIAGASGGPRIITGTTLAILHAINGWPAREAVAAPRFHHQWMPARLDMEPQYAALDWHAHTMAARQTMAQGLADRGYEVREIDRLSVVQLIRRRGQMWEAASDPRKGGRPAGD